MHQRITIWQNDGIVENREEEQNYFMTKVNHVDRRHFDKHVENIVLFNPVGFAFTLDFILYSLKQIKSGLRGRGKIHGYGSQKE